METKNIQPLEGFDWEAFENEGFSAAEKAEATKAYENTLNKVGENDVVDGTVSSLNDREVVVNIGYKSEGVIARSEFRYNPDLKVGDTVEVYIENQEDKKGQERSARTFSQEGTCSTFLGARKRSPRKQRNRKGFCKVPHKGWYDRRCIWNRGILARQPD